MVEDVFVPAGVEREYPPCIEIGSCGFQGFASCFGQEVQFADGKDEFPEGTGDFGGSET